MTKSFQDILRQRTSQSPQILNVKENYDDETKKIYFVRRPEAYVVAIEAASPEEALSIAANGSVEDLIKRNEEFKAKHTYSALSSAALGGLDGLSFGFDDEAAGAFSAVPSFFSYLNPWSNTSWDDVKKDYKRTRDNVREIHQDAEASNPNTYFAGNVAGSFAVPGAVAIKGGGLAAKVAGNGVKAFGKRFLADAAEGAAYNIVDSIGHDQNIAIGAAAGALGGAAGNIVGETILNPAFRRDAASFVSNPVPRQQKAIEGQINGLNHLLNESDLTYGPTFKQNIVDYANHYLPDNFTPQSHPNIEAFQNQLNQIAENNIPVRNINAIVDQSRKIANSASGEERVYLNNIADAIEQRAINPLEGEVLRGADQNLAIYQQKRGLAKRLEKAEALKDMMDYGIIGGYRRTRGEDQFNRIANNLKERFGENTPQELASLKTAVIGTPMQQMLEPSAASYIVRDNNSIRQLVEKDIYDQTVKPLAENLIQIIQEKQNRKILGLALNGGVEHTITPPKWEQLLDIFGKEATSYWTTYDFKKKLNTVNQ